MPTVRVSIPGTPYHVQAVGSTLKNSPKVRKWCTLSFALQGRRNPVPEQYGYYMGISSTELDGFPRQVRNVWISVLKADTEISLRLENLEFR